MRVRWPELQRSSRGSEVERDRSLRWGGGCAVREVRDESRKAQELSGQEIAILSLRYRSTQEWYLYTSSVGKRRTRVRTSNIQKLRSN